MLGNIIMKQTHKTASLLHLYRKFRTVIIQLEQKGPLDEVCLRAPAPQPSAHGSSNLLGDKRD